MEHTPVACSWTTEHHERVTSLPMPTARAADIGEQAKARVWGARGTPLPTVRTGAIGADQALVLIDEDHVVTVVPAYPRLPQIKRDDGMPTPGVSAYVDFPNGWKLRLELVESLDLLRPGNLSRHVPAHVDEIVSAFGAADDGLLTDAVRHHE